MKLHLLRYFCVLAEELHFGRAADRLAITQPPLSSAIKALEEEVGTQLLLRNSKSVQLTAAGVAFLEESRYILERVDRASDVARAVAKQTRDRLDVGTTGSLIYRDLGPVVSTFTREMPGTELVLHEMSTTEQTEALLQGKLHAGFINGSEVPPRLHCLPLREDYFVLCLPASHPKANRIKIGLREVGDEQFVMFSRDVAPANHDSVIAIFSRAGIHPRTLHAARQWLTVVAMVSQGLGIALVPSTLARSRVEGVRFVQVSGPMVVTHAVLAWNASKVSPTLSTFLRIASAVLVQTHHTVVQNPALLRV